MRKLLAETGQQRAGAAADRLGLRDHQFQPRPHDPFLRLGRSRLRQPVAGAGDVLSAIQQQGFRRLAVPSRPADLLVPCLRAVGHIEMRDKAHVRPIDPHAKGDGCNHNQRLAGTEAGEGGTLVLGIEAGMERHRGPAFRAKALSDAFRFVARPAIDDAAAVRVAA